MQTEQRYTVRDEYTSDVVATFDNALDLLHWCMQQSDTASDIHYLDVCISSTGHECPLYSAVYVKHSFYSSGQWAKHEFKNPVTRDNAFVWLEQLKSDLQSR